MNQYCVYLLSQCNNGSITRKKTTTKLESGNKASNTP